ncbi:hypothetical protein [Bacillus safensis]|uniref:hypothetical protein n=1 Tax=Bacillus safensis TaxID=561879 RepID=UPI002E23526C|nr:hypothetical protein [Bacillus safensis]
MKTDPEKVRAALQDFVEITQEILFTDDLAGSKTNPPVEVAKEMAAAVGMSRSTRCK